MNKLLLILPLVLGSCNYTMESYYSSKIEENPNQIEYYEKRAELRYYDDNYIGAKADYNTIIKLDANNINAYSELGIIHWICDSSKTSIFYLTKLLELDSTEAYTYSIRGECKNELKLYEEAIIDFNKAINLNSEDESSYRHRALSKVNLGDSIGAYKDYCMALALQCGASFEDIKYLPYPPIEYDDY